ncbi:hypothetical protein AB0L06_19940 [Spirillospora sp. NPDC052269]
MAYKRPRLAERLRDRLEPDERLLEVVLVTGPLSRRPAAGEIVGEADTLAKRFRAQSTKERACALGVTDRRLIFSWQGLNEADSVLARRDVVGVVASGRRFLGARFLLHLADGSALEFAITKEWLDDLTRLLGPPPVSDL